MTIRRVLCGAVALWLVRSRLSSAHKRRSRAGRDDSRAVVSLAVQAAVLPAVYLFGSTDACLQTATSFFLSELPGAPSSLVVHHALALACIRSIPKDPRVRLALTRLLVLMELGSAGLSLHRITRNAPVLRVAAYAVARARCLWEVSRVFRSLPVRLRLFVCLVTLHNAAVLRRLVTRST